MTSLAKVVVFTKDEHDLVEDFINHHGNLFGYGNIVVIDNGSTHPEVLKLYAEYAEKKGVVVVKDSRGMNHFSSVLTDEMRRRCKDCRFIIPLDTDEFVMPSECIRDHKLLRDYEEIRQKVWRELESMPSEASTVRFAEVYQSIPDAEACNASPIHMHKRPAKEITRFSPQGWDKVFFRADQFVEVFPGNHGGVTRSGTTHVTPHLCLLHFHNTGVGRQLERCIKSITGYRQLDVSAELEGKLRACESIIREGGLFGGHRVEQYYIILRRELAVKEFRRVTGGRLPSLAFIEHALGLKGYRDMCIYIRNCIKSPPTDFCSPNIPHLRTQQIQGTQETQYSQEEAALILHERGDSCRKTFPLPHVSSDALALLLLNIT